MARIGSLVTSYLNEGHDLRQGTRQVTRREHGQQFHQLQAPATDRITIKLSNYTRPAQKDDPQNNGLLRTIQYAIYMVHTWHGKMAIKREHCILHEAHEAHTCSVTSHRRIITYAAEKKSEELSEKHRLQPKIFKMKKKNTHTIPSHLVHPNTSSHPTHIAQGSEQCLYQR